MHAINDALLKYISANYSFIFWKYYCLEESNSTFIYLLAKEGYNKSLVAGHYV
jgi:hypothetical protein